jgi:hypothetical protein
VLPSWTTPPAGSRRWRSIRSSRATQCPEHATTRVCVSPRSPSSSSSPAAARPNPEQPLARKAEPRERPQAEPRERPQAAQAASARASSPAVTATAIRSIRSAPGADLRNALPEQPGRSRACASHPAALAHRPNHATRNSTATTPTTSAATVCRASAWAAPRAATRTTCPSARAKGPWRAMTARRIRPGPISTPRARARPQRACSTADRASAPWVRSTASERPPTSAASQIRSRASRSPRRASNHQDAPAWRPCRALPSAWPIPRRT